MPAGYILVSVDVRDEAKFEEYRKVVGPTVAKYGGEAIVRGGKWETLEGRDPRSIVVVLKFPSYDQAKAWYHSEEYAGPLKIRLESASADLVLVEGVD